MEKKRVVVIDDDELVLQFIKMVLVQTDKYEILTLNDPKDLISRIHTFNPDIILLDLLMPSVGGIEVCEMLNDDPVAKVVPIIVISALDHEADKVKAYSLGVQDYLVKPIRVTELLAKIEKFLRYKKA